MGSVNKVILVGNLGRDPEVRHFQSGTAVANFSIATNEAWNNREGQREEKTEWHRVVVFGKLAEICGQYLSKGKQVYVEGRLQTRSWDDREGNKRSTTEIVATSVVMLGKAPGGASDSLAPPIEEPSYNSRDKEDPPGTKGDDIPF